MPNKFSTIVNRIRSNRDAKTLIENFVSLGVLQSLNLILPLVVLPYLLRVYGNNGYGQVVFVASFVNYFTSITDYSFKITGTRAVANYRHSLNSLSYIYSLVTTVRGVLCIFSFIIITISVTLIPSFREYWYLYALTAPVLVGNVFFPDWFFQGVEKMRFITYLNAGIKLFFTLSVFIFVRGQQDLWLYPFLNSMGFLIAGFAGQLLLIYKFRLQYKFIGAKRIFKTLKRNFHIFIAQFTPNLYNNTSTFLLGFFSPMGMVGIYDAARKVIDLLSMVVSVIERVIFPFIVRRPVFFKKTTIFMNLFGILLTILPILAYPLISNLLGINNSYFLILITILSIGIFFLVQYSLYGTLFLIARGFDKYAMKTSVFASLLGFIASLPLIGLLGMYGAALTVTLSRSILGLGSLYYKKKITCLAN